MYYNALANKIFVETGNIFMLTFYICSDTVSTISLTPPASGSMVVRFHSGSTATVLTVPNTVEFPAWFDETSLDTYTTYEIIITDGVYGGVMSWAD